MARNSVSEEIRGMRRNLHSKSFFSQTTTLSVGGAYRVQNTSFLSQFRVSRKSRHFQLSEPISAWLGLF